MCSYDFNKCISNQMLLFVLQPLLSSPSKDFTQGQTLGGSIA